MVGCKWIEGRAVREEDGTLIVMEGNQHIPFEIKRVFLVRDVQKGVSRGNHATKKTRLILFPVAGTCTVTVDNGTEQEQYYLDDPAKGLMIDPMLWRSMHDFSDGCVLMSLCDRAYEPGNETYENYEEFLLAVKNRKDGLA